MYHTIRSYFFLVSKEEFVPTDEWQVVKEGQAIPKGLHVRLNLQTGVKEAKLLEQEAQPESSTSKSGEKQREGFKTEKLVPISEDVEDSLKKINDADDGLRQESSGFDVIIQFCIYIYIYQFKIHFKTNVYPIYFA